MTFCFLGKCQTNPNPHYAFSGRRFRRLHHASAQKQIRRRNRRTRRTTTKEKNVQEQRERREEYQKTRERRRQRKHHLYEIHPRVRRDRVRLLRFYLPERGEKEEKKIHGRRVIKVLVLYFIRIIVLSHRCRGEKDEDGNDAGDEHSARRRRTRRRRRRREFFLLFFSSFF